MEPAGALVQGHRSAAGMPAREIRFRNVTFAYPTTGEPVLAGFDLTIPAGSSLAIVGQNGAGKTTIAKLLCRLYDPQDGAIEVDGVDLRDLDLDGWRSRVTAVFQDFIRFELPLRDNVAPAGAPDDVIRQALAEAGASGLADLDTVLARGYPGGTDLSGGQWQRVALARALCAVRLGAGLVLLDEPTAQLDVRGEAEIFDRILAATRHTTTILISHRFSTVRHADRICVLEHGKVVELGTHDELMAAGGRYRTMFELQASRFGDDDEEGARPRCPRLTTCRRALPAMWRALKRGYEAEPLLLSVAFGLSLLAALPDALLALWLKLLADGVLGGRRGLVLTAAVGLGVSAAATWFLRVISDRTQRRFRDRVTIALESHVARLQASVATIEHHERPEYLDRLAVLRNQVFVLDHMYMSLFTTCGWILRLGVTLALLVSIHPALALLAVFALPTVLTSTWRPGVERAAEERGAAANRLARHLFDVATTAPPGKEVRVTGIGARLVAQRREAWERWYGPVAAARRGSALWHALGWAIFGAGVRRRGGVRVVGAQGDARRRAAGAGGGLAAVGLHRRDGGRDRLPARHLARRLRRLAWLEDYAAALVAGRRRARARATRRKASASSTCPSPIPAPSASCSTT